MYCTICNGIDPDCATCAGLSPQGRELVTARLALEAASRAAKLSAAADVAAGVSEVEAARRHGMTRPTLRKWLGK